MEKFHTWDVIWPCIGCITFKEEFGESQCIPPLNLLSYMTFTKKIYHFNSSSSFMALNAMPAEDSETPCGWPFGLAIMNMRLEVPHSLRAARPEPYPSRAPSSSLSSFQSSYLDTESSASFFQDHSVSLGRLLKMRPTARDDHHNYRLSTSVFLKEHEIMSRKCLPVDVSSAKSQDMCQGICIPLVLGLREKLNSSKRVKPTYAVEDSKSLVL